MKPRLVLGPCLVALLSLAVAAPAAAQPSATPPVGGEARAAPTEEWYGWKIAIVDGLSGLIYLSSFSDGAGGFGRFMLGFTGAMTWFGGAAAHGRYSWGKMFLSTGLRAAAATAALSLADRDDLDRSDVLLYVPAAAVSLLDIMWLGRGRPRAGGTAPFSLVAAPTERGGMMVGLGGAF